MRKVALDKLAFSSERAEEFVQTPLHISLRYAQPAFEFVVVCLVPLVLISLEVFGFDKLAKVKYKVALPTLVVRFDCFDYLDMAFVYLPLSYPCSIA